MHKTSSRSLLAIVLVCLASLHVSVGAEDWPQLLGNAQHSGDAPETSLQTPIGLVAAIPTDRCDPGRTGRQRRKGVCRGWFGSCFCDRHARRSKSCGSLPRAAVRETATTSLPRPWSASIVHVGTMAGYYYVLDRDSGTVVKEIDCGEPIFASPVVGEDRVYFATLGARVYAVEPRGDVVWTWDFVKEVDRLRGRSLEGRGLACLSRRPRDVAGSLRLFTRHLPGRKHGRHAGRRTNGLSGRCRRHARVLRAVGEIPAYLGNEYPATFGQSADAAGNVYVQWHRRDNAGRVEIMRLDRGSKRTKRSCRTGDRDIDRSARAAEFCFGQRSRSDVYRVRPEHGRGLCRHTILSKRAASRSRG